MYIKELEIEGFRGFSELVKIDFHSRVNVFVGVNGSGKTSILDAVALLLKKFIATNFPDEGFEPTIIFEDLSSINPYVQLKMIAALEDKTAKWSLEKHAFFNVKRSEEVKSIQYLRQKLFAKEPSSLPILTYYRANKRTDEQPTEQLNKSLSLPPFLYHTYANAFGEDIGSFEDFTAWYIEEENQENRIRLREDSNFKNPALSPARLAIERFFDMMGNRDELSKLYVDVPPKRNSHFIMSSKPTLFIHKNKEAIQLNQLSDGEKMMVLLVSDIARRLTIAALNQQTEEIINGKGIVLIDEIEMHLHPSWQRKIIPALTKTFPNLQFVITTHSPQVLSNVQKKSVHVIEDFKLVPLVPPTFGKDSNSILWEIFGVKKQPEHAEALFEKFYHSLEKEDKHAAKEALEVLKKLFGTDYPSVYEAEMSFSFTFDLGEN